MTPFFKVRICDYQMSKKEAREATLTIWQPDELLNDTIKEGNRYKVNTEQVFQLSLFGNLLLLLMESTRYILSLQPIIRAIH